MRKEFEMFNKEIENFIIDFAKSDDCYKEDVEIYVFPQMWGSTALGYSGIGGQAMTGSHTIVLHNVQSGNVMISYGGRFIRINQPNRTFFEDLSKMNIASEFNLGRYRRKDE